ncbi:MAG: hypothetical protein ABJF88_04720 [Rhodothermales bacterium]
MGATGLTFDGRTVEVAGHRWPVPVRVLDGVRIEERVVLLFDWVALAAHENRLGQVQNLRGYTPAGEHMWTAQHPTNTSADFYAQIVSRVPLVVANFVGTDCTIDPLNGRLLHQDARS